MSKYSHEDDFLVQPEPPCTTCGALMSWGSCTKGCDWNPQARPERNDAPNGHSEPDEQC